MRANSGVRSAGSSRSFLERSAYYDEAAAYPSSLFLNSHRETRAYLRVGIFCAVCTNGLIVAVGVFPPYRLPHRGDVVHRADRGALEMRFGVLGTTGRPSGLRTAQGAGAAGALGASNLAMISE